MNKRSENGYGQKTEDMGEKTNKNKESELLRKKTPERTKRANACTGKDLGFTTRRNQDTDKQRMREERK